MEYLTYENVGSDDDLITYDYDDIDVIENAEGDFSNAPAAE